MASLTNRNVTGSLKDKSGNTLTKRYVHEKLSEESIDSMISQKDKRILILIAYFGYFGLDQFYRGQTGLGVLKLLTMGGCGVWSFIDVWCYILGKLVQDSDGKYIVDRKTLDPMRNG